LTTDFGTRFAAFVDPLPRDTPIAVLCHNDGDGLAAGAILTHTPRRRDRVVVTLTTGKGENAWSAGVRERLGAIAPGALVVTDLGCRDEPLLPEVPTLFIDHHQPRGVPAGATLLTGYGDEPTPTSGLIAFWCGLAVAEIDDLDWIAAISLISDIGDGAPFAELDAAKRRWKATPLRDATTLLNAPRRSSSGDARPALDLLLAASGPRDITKGDRPEVALLQAAKAEVNREFAEAKKASPKFSGSVAMIRIHSPCQVHPLIARIWRTRLPAYIVMAVNTGYLPGYVNFSARSKGTVNLLDFLREHAPADAGDAYGFGHDQASGGSLRPATWNAFARSLGFGPEMLVDVG
jgi:single-stranded-DNA-specific exonuclease